MFIKEKVVYFVEVKTCDERYDLSQRVTCRQIQRLQRAVTWWAGRVCKEPSLILAFVNLHKNHVILRVPNEFL